MTLIARFFLGTFVILFACAGANPKYLDLNPQAFPELFALFGRCQSRVDYWRRVPGPTPWFSDEYGIHVLRRIGKEEVKKDLVGTGSATIEEESADSLTLFFDQRFHLVFFFDRALRVNNLVDEGHDYLYFKAASMEELIGGLERFHQFARDKGLEEKYFLPNPHRDREIEVAERWSALGTPAPVISDPQLNEFPASRNSVLIVGDPVHGDEKRYEEIRRLLGTESFSWFGIEMFPSANQKDLDRFLTAPEGSPAYLEARRVVMDKIWHGYFPYDPAHPERNRYFQLIELCRERHIPVYGLDGEASYSLWSHGETPFGTSVRSSFWADAIARAVRRDLSTIKRGIVFGGAGHFDNRLPVNVQDFLKQTNPALAVYWLGTWRGRDFFQCTATEKK